MPTVAGMRTFAGPSVSQQAGPQAVTSPRADTRDFIDHTASQGGKALMAFGQDMADAEERKLKEDGAVLAAKKMAELRQSAAQDATNVGERMKVIESNGTFNVVVETDGQDPHNGKYVSKYLEDSYNDRATAMLKDVQNPYAKQHLGQSVAAYRTDVVSSGLHMEATARRSARLESLGQTIELNANQVRTNPALLQTALRETEDAIKGSRLGGIDEAKTVDAAKATLAYSAMNGMVEKDWRMARSILTDEKNPDYQVFNGLLKPNQKDHLLSQIDQQVRIEKANLRSEVSQSMQDHFASLGQFGQGLPGFRERYAQAYADEPHMIQAFNRREQITRHGYNASQQIKTASLADIPAIVEGLMPKGAGVGTAEALQVAGHVQSLADQHVRALVSDPAGMVQSLFKDELGRISDPAQRLSRSIELQRMKGIDRPQIFSKAETQQALMDIQSAKPEQVISTIQGIIDRTGKVSVPFGGDVVAARDLAFDQLQSATNGLPPVYLALVGAVEDGDGKLAHDLSKVLTRRKEGLYSMLPDKETDLKTIRTEINTALADWKTGAAQGGVERAEAIKAVTTAVEELALSKTFDGLSPADAAKAAANDLVLNKYAAIRGGLQIPKRLPGIDGEVNAQRVFSGLAKEREFLSTDFKAKQALAFTLKGEPRWANSDLRELVHETALSNGRWVNNNSNTGALYQITLRDGSNLFLRNPDGSMYEVPFTKAMEIGNTSVTPIAGADTRTTKAKKFEEAELRRIDQGARHGIRFMENDGAIRPGRLKVFEDGTRRILPEETK